MELLEEHALAQDMLDASRVQAVRAEMERTAARRLQPHYIESFFLEAFQQLGGTIRQREPRRYEITHVPAPIRNRDRLIGVGEPVPARYERIAFDKELLSPQGQAPAAFVCPGHPLLDATLDLILERHRNLLRRGTVLVDERDPGTSQRVLFYLEHALQDAGPTRSGERRTISKRMLYVELDAAGRALSVRDVLALINQTLDEVLAEQEGDFDADTRWAVAWFEGHGFDEGDYGVAETLSKAKNTAVAGMVEAGIFKSRGGKVRLLTPGELPDSWDPEQDKRLTTWEVVHYLVRALNTSEAAAGDLLARLGAKADPGRELAYRLYIVCERKKRAADALAYNALVQSWPEIERLARETSRRPAQQASLLD